MKQLWKKRTGSPAPKRLEAGIGPDRVRLDAFGGLLARTRLARREQGVPAVGGEAGWPAALAELERLLEQQPASGAALSVAISSRWLRFVLLPRREELVSAGERLEYARHLFVTRFGIEAEGWKVRLVEGSARDMQLACAIRPGIIGDLQTLCARMGVTLCRVEAVALSTFNAHRKRLGTGRHWFVAQEAGTVFVALVDEGTWRSVAVRHIVVGSAEDLAGLLDTEQQLLGEEGRIEQVMASALEGLARPAEQCGYRFSWLGGEAGTRAG